MKVFEVVTERDGKVTAIAGTGQRTTEIERTTYIYGAETMQDVWEAAIGCNNGGVSAEHRQRPAKK